MTGKNGLSIWQQKKQNGNYCIIPAGDQKGIKQGSQENSMNLQNYFRNFQGENKNDIFVRSLVLDSKYLNIFFTYTQSDRL